MFILDFLGVYMTKHKVYHVFFLFIFTFLGGIFMCLFLLFCRYFTSLFVLFLGNNFAFLRVFLPLFLGGGKFNET